MRSEPTAPRAESAIGPKTPEIPASNAGFTFARLSAIACPPEDCGGVSGYQELRAALADPAHPEHHECLAWAGADFDPAAFAASEITSRLRRVR